MRLRCVYTDLDGTLLGAGASLFRTGGGEFTLLPARALQACHRAGVEVVCVSGRRKAQVMEDARLLGQDSYVYEIGSGVVVAGEEHLLCGAFTPTDERTPHQLIEESGAPALLLSELEGRLEYLHPYHRDRFVSHLFRGTVAAAEANAVLQRGGHTGLRLLDNGSPDPASSIFHLVPVETSKVGAVALHMQARGYAAGECIAVGDSVADMAMAEAVGRFFLVANSDASIAHLNVARTEAGHGDGFYEAVLIALTDS